jgi:hypothetical protein
MDRRPPADYQHGAPGISNMKRALLIVALFFSLATSTVAQQGDPVLMQIEADRQAWLVYLNQQHELRGSTWRWEYERQLATLERNIEARRQQRLAEIAEAQRKADLERRQVQALERLANQPPVVVQQAPARAGIQPSLGTRCTTQWLGNAAHTSCY